MKNTTVQICLNISRVLIKIVKPVQSSKQFLNIAISQKFSAFWLFRKMEINKFIKGIREKICLYATQKIVDMKNFVAKISFENFRNCRIQPASPCHFNYWKFVLTSKSTSISKLNQIITYFSYVSVYNKLNTNYVIQSKKTYLNTLLLVKIDIFGDLFQIFHHKIVHQSIVWETFIWILIVLYCLLLFFFFF